MSETIYALSSGIAPAAVAIVRISGSRCREVLESMCSHVPVSRETVLSKVWDPDTGELLDEALVLWFEGPASYTGEDSGEIHVHGGRAVIQSVLNVLSRFEGLRMAEPGEFTKRAFFSEKIDLSVVEGLADLISAETEEQRKFAIGNSTGALFEICDKWRGKLISLRAMIEAELDFSDEEDVPESVSHTIWNDLRLLCDEIKSHLEYGKRAERIREGMRIVIMGKPNAGKSSLINQLAQRDVAIVTEEEGTTRDVLAVHLDLEGFPATVFDTAGIRNAVGLAENEGIRKALEQAGSADLVLEVVDAVQSGDETAPPLKFEDVPVWTLMNKSDLIDDSRNETIERVAMAKENGCLISAKTGEGIAELLKKLAGHCKSYWKGSEGALVNRERHRELLKLAVGAIDRSISGSELPLELRAEDLRAASDQIGKISGRVDAEDLLDVIFNEFCIGK